VYAEIIRGIVVQTQSYHLAEEIVNAITHGLAALLSVAGLTLLVTLAWLQNDILKTISFAIYGTSLILLFSASTLYHALLNEKAKNIFKLLDHCAIYLLIAGTYTPLMMVTLADDIGMQMLAVIWGIALLGVLFKVKFGNKYKKLSLATYFGMGLISLTVINKLNAQLATEGMILLALGGLIYGLGTIFYVQKSKKYSHAIWHVFVLAAAVCHFLMMLFYVL
jgi:hemolysin III